MSALAISLLLAALLLLLAGSAFFAGSETALMSISKLRLKHLAKTNPSRTAAVERVLEKPERLIGTILLGNNLVNVAMSAIATFIAVSLWGEPGIAYATGVLTLVILIFADMVPKIYARYSEERVSFMSAPVLRVIMTAFNPLVIAASFVATRVLLMFGLDVARSRTPPLTEDMIKTVIEVGSDQGAITGEERRMLARVFTLNDKTVREVMVPRDKMTVIDIGTPLDGIVKAILKTGYTRMPVSRGPGLHIVGSLHAKDFLGPISRKKPASLQNIMRPPYFVHQDRTIDAQLRGFRARKSHQAVVLDADGDVVGLVTMEDILEELVGNIEDEHDVR